MINTIAEGLGLGATPNGGIHIFIIRDVNQAKKNQPNFTLQIPDFERPSDKNYTLIFRRENSNRVET